MDDKPGPPPYQPYQPQPNQQQGGTTNVIVAPAGFMGNFGPHVVGPGPQPMTCPNCKLSITTRVKRSPNSTAWIVGAILCLVGCSIGCCLIPCCLDSMKTTTHHCPNCHYFVGRFRG